jgi:hypothetical protein
MQPAAGWFVATVIQAATLSALAGAIPKAPNPSIADNATVATDRNKRMIALSSLEQPEPQARVLVFPVMFAQVHGRRVW